MSTASIGSEVAAALRVYVVRHGKVGRPGERKVPDPRWAREDPRLLPVGRRMAEAVGRRLAAEELDYPLRIVASPLWRTSETAQLIAEALETRFCVEPGMMEICLPPMHAAFRGLTPQEAGLVFDRLENPEALLGSWWPAAPETRESCRARVAATLDRLLPRWQAEGVRGVVLVGHGASTDAAVAHLAGLEDCPGGHDLCGVSQLDLFGYAPPARLGAVNCQKHLAHLV